MTREAAPVSTEMIIDYYARTVIEHYADAHRRTGVSAEALLHDKEHMDVYDMCWLIPVIVLPIMSRALDLDDGAFLSEMFKLSFMPNILGALTARDADLAAAFIGVHRNLLPILEGVWLPHVDDHGQSMRRLILDKLAA